MERHAMRTWALKGAEQRLLEISEEAAAIYASFPELRDTGGINRQTRRGPGRPRTAAGDSNDAGSPRGRRKRTMSADARRRISEAQKARWARQKGGAEATPDGSSDAVVAQEPSGQKRTRKTGRKGTRKASRRKK